MFDKMRQGDKVISALDEAETEKFLDVKCQYDEFNFFKRKMIRAHNKFQAMQIMFWEDMMGKHELCETAAHRGKVLSACKVDDKMVVIERPQELVDLEGDEDEEMFG